MYLENKKDNSVVGKCIYVVQTKLSVLSPFIQTPEKDKRKKKEKKKKERKRKQLGLSFKALFYGHQNKLKKNWEFLGL